MVRVLKCHNFKSQSIIQVENEPVLLTAGKEKVFIVTQDSNVEVFSANKVKDGNPWVKFCSFQTGAPVLQILYNKAANYIACLECKKSRLSEVYSVKVYLNWQAAHTNPGHHRTRVRIAGMGIKGYQTSQVMVAQLPVTSGLKKSYNMFLGASPDSQLEVIDIPCERPSKVIATCQETGNLGIAFENMVQVYHLVEKTVPASQSTYLDIQIFLKLQYEYIVKKLTLCEDYVGTSSSEQGQVIQVIYLDGADSTKQNKRSRDPDSHSIRSGSNTAYNRKLSSVISTCLANEYIPAKKEPINSQHMTFSNVGVRGSSTPSPALTTIARIFQIKNSETCLFRPPMMTTKCGQINWTGGWNTEVAPDCSSVEDDPDFVQWTFDDDTPSSGARKDVGVVSKTVFLKGLTELSSHEEKEVKLPRVTDLRGGDHHTVGDIQVVSKLSRVLNDKHDSYRHIQLIPTYITKSEPRHASHETLSPHPMHSNHHIGLASMCCLLSSSQKGTMYSLIPGTKTLSSYKYTLDARQVVSDGNLLYVVTSTSLETYTARCHCVAVSNTEKPDHITKAFPPSDLDICLCGLHAFLGVREITLSDNCIILLSKVQDTQTDSVWNVYALENCGAVELYKDMVAFGTRYQEKGQDTYQHLLQEGHMVLKCAQIGYPSDDVTTVSDMLQESCALLGEIYSMPHCDNWRLCLPYYLMSGLSPADVVRQSLQYKQHSKKTTPYCYGKGLAHYLNYVLFRDEDQLELKESDCDLILDVWAETHAERLSDLILHSRLTGYSPDKAMNLLKMCIKQRPSADNRANAKDLLAMASLSLRMVDPESALAALNNMIKNDLIELCISHHKVLHTDFMELSPLSQLMRCHCPNLLIQMLVSLHDRGTIPLDLAIKLLQGKTGVPELHKNSHVQEYLEQLLNDVNRKYIFEEAALMLCDIYIRKLVDWEPPSCRQLTTSLKFRLPSGSGHFGRRHAWLDYLPPFLGPKSIKQTCSYVKVVSGVRRSTLPTNQQQFLQCQRSPDVCPCFLCNEDLLKLQSILCSRFSTTDLVKKVLSSVETHERLTGSDSINILCLIKVDVEAAVNSVVNKYPGVAAKFGVGVLDSSYDNWSHLLGSILEVIKKQKPEEDSDTYLKALKDVLTELAQIFRPADFLNLLPADGNFDFFLPYISLSMERQQCLSLKQKIIDMGHNSLKSMKS